MHRVPHGPLPRLREVNAKRRFEGRIERDDWITQAQALARRARAMMRRIRQQTRPKLPVADLAALTTETVQRSFATIRATRAGLDPPPYEYRR